ncbi:MAG: hypothetical protein RL217_229, partial [Pseudomonadota bacterium]
TRSVSDALAKVAAFLLVFGLALVESRTSWVAAVFILGFWAWQSRKLTLRLSVKQVFYWFLLFAFLVFFIPIAAQWLFGKDNTLLAHATAVHRWDLYKQFIYALQEGPWYGYGWEQINQAQVLTAAAYPLQMNTRYTHNILLDLLIWNGPVLGAVMIAVVALWWFKLLKNANNLAATYAWVALSFFILHAMLEYPHAYAFLLIPAAVLLGGLQGAEINQEKTEKMPAWVLAAFALCAFGIIALFWHDYRIVEEKHIQTNLASRDDFAQPVDVKIDEIIMLTQMQDYLHFIELPVLVSYNEDQLDYVRKIVWRFPRPYVLYKSASILTLNNRVDEAFQTMMLMAQLFKVEHLESSVESLYKAALLEPRLAPLLERFGLTVKAAPGAPAKTQTDNTPNP